MIIIIFLLFFVEARTGSSSDHHGTLVSYEDIFIKSDEQPPLSRTSSDRVTSVGSSFLESRASISIDAGADFGLGLLTRAASRVGFGPALFVAPIMSAILGPTAQDVSQKLGNFMAAASTARLDGLLTGLGDTHRPVVLLWLIKDALTKAQAVLTLVKARVEVAKALAAAKLAAAKLRLAVARQKALDAKERLLILKAQKEAELKQRLADAQATASAVAAAA